MFSEQRIIPKLVRIALYVAAYSFVAGLGLLAGFSFVESWLTPPEEPRSTEPRSTVASSENPPVNPVQPPVPAADPANASSTSSSSDGDGRITREITLYPITSDLLKENDHRGSNFAADIPKDSNPVPRSADIPGPAAELPADHIDQPIPNPAPNPAPNTAPNPAPNTSTPSAEQGRPENSSAADEPPVFETPAPTITNKGEAIAHVNLQNVRFKLGQTGQALITSDVINSGNRNVRDLEIACELVENSGTHVFRKQTVNQIVSARHWRRLHRVDFGPIGSETVVKTCLITDLALD